MNCGILLVEDDPVQSALLMRAFADAGVGRLWHAHSGHEGLKMFETFQPEVVVLDIMLPSMNGLSVARAIRRQSANVRIVGYSSVARLAREEDRQVFDAWLERRPETDASELIAVVRRVVGTEP